MSADHHRAREILADVERQQQAGTLTKESFLEAYAELAKALGDGPESSGVEALALYAEDESWLPAA